MLTYMWKIRKDKLINDKSMVAMMFVQKKIIKNIFR